MPGTSQRSRTHYRALPVAGHRAPSRLPAFPGCGAIGLIGRSCGMFLTFKWLEGVGSFDWLVPVDDSAKESMMAKQQVFEVSGMTCDGCAA